MIFAQRVAVCGALIAAAWMPGASQAQLNDTGLVSCYNATATTGTVSGETPLPEDAGFQGQDCTRGRAAADAQGVLSKTGAGQLGFDFTKLANDGSELPAGAAFGNNPGDWGCTRDNVTGLVWEVKALTPSNVLRYAGHVYSWYDTDASINGGNAGSTSGGSCASTISPCTTTGYVSAVNGLSLCGFTDWRMPSVQELQSLLRYQGPLSGSSAHIDSQYFPGLDINGASHWSGTNFAPNAVKAWAVVFAYGSAGVLGGAAKTEGHPVMLVRSSP